MRVRIDKGVFAEATDEMRQQELNFLLSIIIYKRRYDLVVTDAEVLSSAGFAHLTQTEKKIIKETLINVLTASRENADCEVAMNGETEDDLKIFTPEEAIVYLLQPLSVILENGLNDAHFMRAVFRLFDTSGELTRRESEGWIRFENAGGCSNVKNFLTARIKSFGDKQKFLNCFVLLDGDRRYPTDPEPEKKYRKLKEQLEAWGVGCHVLEKRCMENYIPDEAIRSVAGAAHLDWINAYMTLTASQKDFLSISEGFETDITKEEKRTVRAKESLLMTKDKKRRKKSYVRGFLPTDELLFYTSVLNGNFLHLEKGLKVKNFKVQFPMAFNNPVVTYKSNLLQRTAHQNDPYELEHIVQEISATL